MREDHWISGEEPSRLREARPLLLLVSASLGLPQPNRGSLSLQAVTLFAHLVHYSTCTGNLGFWGGGDRQFLDHRGTPVCTNLRSEPVAWHHCSWQASFSQGIHLESGFLCHLSRRFFLASIAGPEARIWLQAVMFRLFVRPVIPGKRCRLNDDY